MSVESLWHDLLEAERLLRRSAEEMARRWRDAFFAVAAAAAEEEYESRLRSGALPSSPEEAARWLISVLRSSWGRAPALPAPRPGAPDADGEAARLREEIRRLREEVERLRARAAEPLPQPPPAARPTDPAPEPEAWPETHPAPPADAGELMEIIRRASLPPMFQKDFFQKDALLVGLIGRYGLSGRPRLAKALGAALGISPKSGSISRAFDRCVRLGLLRVHRDPAAPFSLFSLSPRGEEAFRAVFGRDPEPSEADLLLSAHPGAVAHAAFCVWARELAEAAGYLVSIPGRPAVPGPSPDLILRSGSLVLPVEVERALAHDPDKWRAIAAARGLIAVVAVDPEAAERLLAVIAQISAPHAVTDFSYLVERQPRDPAAFWRVVRGIPDLEPGSGGGTAAGSGGISGGMGGFGA
jgi:hypothetical protein